MTDGRNFYQGPDSWDCYGHFDHDERDAEVEIIHQLLRTGKPFFSSEKVKELDVVQQQLLHPVAEPTVTAEPNVEETSSQTLSVPPTPADTGSEPTIPLPLPTTKAKKVKALKHKCETCCQVFDSRIALSIHSGRIHKSDGRDKNYQCPYCTKSFYNSSYLSQHIRIHTGLKPYECTMCHKTFKQLSHLQQHERTHSGEKPYRCKEPGCTKAFSQLSNLQSHSRSHLPDGNVHKCTSCYKCYYDEASLNAHLRTHMVNKRVRNYICNECGKSYTQDTYLQNHIKNKHAGIVSAGLAGAGLVGGNADKLAYAPRPAVQQPTSIQAATSMICKVEEQTAACRSVSLGSSIRTPLMQQVQQQQQQQQRQHGGMNKLMTPTPTVPSVASLPSPALAGVSGSGQGGYNVPEGSYNRLTNQYLFPSPGRFQYEDHCSAFKPLPRLALQGMDTVSAEQAQAQARQRSSSGHTTSSSPYELLSNTILPLAPQPQQDNKSGEVERRQGEADMYRKFQNMAAAYPTLNSQLNSQIQSYMVGSGGGYGSAPYGSYGCNTDSIYSADKASIYHQHDKSNMFENDSSSDYYIGGLREAYSLD